MMERPDYDEEIEFWRKRAEYYEKMCMTLVAEISDGVIFESISIDEDGIRFTKKQSERKKGKWLKAYGDHEAFGVRPFYRYCSECNESTVWAYNYCPNCGADMRGEDDD